MKNWKGFSAEIYHRKGEHKSGSPLRGAAYELPEEGVSIATRFITHSRNIGYVFDLNAGLTVRIAEPPPAGIQRDYTKSRLTRQ